MDYNQLKDRLTQVMDKLSSKTNIKMLLITEDKVVVESEESFTFDEPKTKEIVKPKQNKGNKGNLKFAKSKIRDPRWIPIVETLHLTPRQWVEKNYPNLEPSKLYSYMHYHTEMSLRQCCERLSQE